MAQTFSIKERLNQNKNTAKSNMMAFAVIDCLAEVHST